MKKIIPIFLLSFLFANICIAQQRIEYANFIKTDTAIKWAAVYNSYVNLTPANPSFSIRNFYINKLRKQGVTAYIDDSTALAVTPINITYSDYRSSIRPVNRSEEKMNWWFRVDDKKNALETIFTKESNKCDTCPLINKLLLFKVKQLLYYKEGQFKIQNILLNPIIYTKPADSYKEDASYYEASDLAFNEIKADETSVPPTAKFIARSFNNLILKSLPDSLGTGNKFLINGGPRLISLLYRDIKDQKIQAYSTDRSIYPDPHNILSGQKIDEYKKEPQFVSIMDSTGNITGTRKVLRDINFDDLFSFTLIQDFYFDFTKEKLYSKLVALVPRIVLYTSAGQQVGFVDYWGIIFSKEKKKRAKQTK